MDDNATNEALAAIGTSVANVDTYESSVIREATLKTAPTLSGVGFPDLSSLGPSFDARKNKVLGSSGSSDTPHVQTILSRTRTELARTEPESHRSLVLQMKEQMLLTYLQKVSGFPPEPGQQQQQQSRIKKKVFKEDGRLARSVTSASATASFGKQALLERNKERGKRRTSMMQLKQNQQPQVVNEEDEELKEMLRQRRKERHERRQRRAEQWAERKEEVEEDEDEEVTFDDDSSNKSRDDAVKNEKSAGQEAADSGLTCPICEEVLNAGSTQEESDAILAQHMEACQQGGRRTRRRGQSGGDQKGDIATRQASAATRQKVKEKTKSQKSRPVSRSVRSAVDDLQIADYEDRVDDWIESGLERMRHMEERDETETPPGAVTYDGGLVIPAWMNNRLFPYQRTGLRWMWELHMQEAGGVVGDEMGLGKTVQVSAYLGAMAASRKLESILVIGPATILQHWLTELSTWAPGLRRILIHQSGESDGLPRTVTTKLLKSLDKWLRSVRADRLNEAIDEEDFETFDEGSFCGTGYVVVTTYENIRRSPDIWTSHNWSYVVMDEGQKIRNPDADVTIACKRMRTPHRLLLSGTPIQNDLRELWSLFDFVFPGRLGTLPAFEAEFADPIKRGGYSNASPMQVQLAYRYALVLRDLINPYLLRRQKKDINEVSRMPGKTEQVLFCRLTNRQRSLYEAFIRSDEVIGVLRGSKQLLGAITVLRKICNHPDLVCGPDQAAFDSFVRNGFVGNDVLDDESSNEDEDIDTNESMVERAGKLQVLAKILPLWRKQGHRVLIFSQWTRVLNILQRFTQLQGWQFARLDGSTNVASRQRLVNEFNKEDSPYFGMLLTTRTGGVGLNLTGADRIILYDPDWNPQTDAQARERAWRFGQKNAVTVYRLITAGTIEEKIYQRQIFKTALTNKILQDPKQRRLFSQKDLKDFFTLKPDVGSIAKGGEGFTETGEITKGVGVVDPDEAGDELAIDNEDAVEDNVSALQEVLKSKGLAGVFDHDVVDYSKSKNKSSSIREMEEKAKAAARNAARELKKSSAGNNPFFEPTFTGSAETGAGRFGGRVNASGPGVLGGPNGFGGSGTAGVARSAIGGGMGSRALLENLKKRHDPSKGNSGTLNGDTSRYAELMKRIQNFVIRKGGDRQGGGPTTEEILKAFDKVPNCDAAIFRRLLNSVASVDRGKWRLKT